jgi:DNA segregation ATPase FtsK/SpoIIIE, S-DNA-T family
MALIAGSDEDLWTADKGRRQVDSPPSSGLSLPSERADAVHALLAERVRLTGELATSEVAENKLRAAAKTASANTPDVLAPPLAAGVDAMAELLARAADASGHVERINVLRKDARHRQQAIANLRGLFKKRKARTQTEFLDQVKAELEMERDRLGMCEQRGLLAARQLRRSLHTDVARAKNDVTDLDRSMATENDMPWNLARWESWRAIGCTNTNALRVGQFRESGTGEMLDLPLVVPFVGTGRPIVVVSEGDAQHEQAAALMQSFIMRTLAMFPRQAKYTLLDPSGNGLAFPMARNVPKVTSGTGDVRRDLDEVTREIQRVIRTYLDPSRPTFEDIPDEMRLAESYHFVFVADFPNGYDLRAAEALQTIAKTGAKAGVYVFVHVNKDRERQALGEFGRYGIENPTVIDLAETYFELGDVTGEVVFDEAPSASLQELIFNRLKQVPPRDQPIAWEDVNALPESEWWQESSEQLISAPIGRHGAGVELNVWFGTDQWQQRACVHGVLGAMPGAGKSTLFHNLITALSIRYSPDELRFYLIDGKYGVEFMPYAQLPHAAVVSLRTSPAMSRSVLTDVVAEMARRNAAFARCGVVDLPGYRRCGQPEGNFPRLLLVVDEYQQLFDGDRDGEASANLLRLSQQGRSAGIHMLLASQRFDTAGMLHRADIFGNMHLRIAMQIAQADAATLTDFGLKGRRMIAATCDRVGRLVLNERAGDDEANMSGKAALLDVHRRDEIIRALAHKAVMSSKGSFRARTIVFHGDAQPELVDNPHVQELLQAGLWPDSYRMEALARGATDHNGLGVTDWLAAERPLAFFLGQEFNVRGYATVVVRRRAAEHLLIIGEQHEARIAMVASAITSAALIEAPGGLQVWVNDRSVERTPWSTALHETVNALGVVGFDVEFGGQSDDLAHLLHRAEAEIRRRAALSELALLDEPSILLVLNQPDRVAALQRVTDDYGRTDSELGSVLRQILAVGSTLGIHVVLAATSLGVLRSVVADQVVQNDIRHRIVLQMPEDDSFLLVRSSQASRLQLDGDRPIAALAFDSHKQLAVRFKPYCLGAGPDDTAKVDLVGQILGIVGQLADRLG